MPSPSRLGCLLAAAAAALVYINTLPAGFTFDDNFAVTRNRDVLSTRLNLRALLHHDFWGQRLKSNQSHKSYRPLTVISFWCIRALWQLLPQSWTSPVSRWRVELARSGQPSSEELPPPGIDPLPYHAANMLLHALASALVCRLAYHLFQLRLKICQSTAVPPQRPAVQQEGPDKGSGQAASQCSEDDIKPALQLIHVHLPAWMSGLWFALHPVHTEAVAGVVGQAELLCACLAIPALLLYFSAADADVAHVSCTRDDGTRNTDTPLARTAHWARVLAAVLLTWGAALSKEIGITFIGCMAAYDVLLVPLVTCDARAGSAKVKSQPASGVGRWQHLFLHRKWCRLFVLAAALLLYVHTRTALAGDQLVRIYRKVENPIAFAPDRLTRLLSTAHLHTRYAWLLVWPQHLSADWSHACVALVHSLADVRNLPSAALYVYVIITFIRAQPWTIPVRWYHQAATGAAHTSGADPTCSTAMWRLFVLTGLALGPFLPASNILFYVGTFIGERLLYCPSIGAVMLASELLFPRLLANLMKGQAGGWQRASARTAAVLLALCVSGSLVAAAGRTWSRNWDWFSEETLFVSAQQVCGSSAKVALNSGILARRHQAYEAALHHFYTARDIEPHFCEPAYWIGITLMNQGDVQGGLVELEAALKCKWVAADALSSLYTVYQALQQASPQDATWLIRWGTLLVQPHVGRVAEGCEALESGALLLMTPVMHLTQAQRPPQAAVNIAAAAHALKSCEEAVVQLLNAGGSAGMCVNRQAKEGGSQSQACEASHPGSNQESAPLTGGLAHQFLDCVQGRASVYSALLQHGLASLAARQALYRYVHHVRGSTPGCRLSGNTWTQGGHLANSSEPLAGSADLHSPAHMQLIHRFQATDADDPWLQQEWGEVLHLTPARAKDAIVHLAAAGMLFSSWAHTLSQGVTQQQKVVSLTGGPMSTFACVAAAGDAYARAVAVARIEMGMQHGALTAFAGHATLCDLMQRAVDARMAATQWAEGDAAREQVAMLGHVWRQFREYVAALASRQTPDETRQAAEGSILSSENCRMSLNELNQKLESLGLLEAMRSTASL